MKKMEEIFHRLHQAEAFCQAHHRPFVVASYAQSINGSIAGKNNAPILLSAQDALVVTHRLRAACDGILVGIETVLADDPQLTARFAEGPDPQPIILDSRLRMPLDARLLQRTDRPAWLFCHHEPDQERVAALRARGAVVFPCETETDGTLRLADILAILATHEIHSLMVEGGAKVLSAFLAAQCVDLVCITIAPVLLDGKQVFESSTANHGGRIVINDVYYYHAGRDVILWGIPEKE